MTSGKTYRFNPPIMTITICFVIAAVASPIKGLDLKSRKLDESTIPGNQSIKCAPSCIPIPPPPPPACPPPPPPPCPPPPPPPCTPDLPPPLPTCQFCPTPPSPTSSMYVTGTQGNLYPVDHVIGAASRELKVGLVALVSGFLVLFTLSME